MAVDGAVSHQMTGSPSKACRCYVSVTDSRGKRAKSPSK